MDDKTFKAFCKAAVKVGTVTQDELASIAPDILRKLVIAGMYSERERCAKLCEGLREAAEHSGEGLRRAGAMSMATACARLIRA